MITHTRDNILTNHWALKHVAFRNIKYLLIPSISMEIPLPKDVLGPYMIFMLSHA
jgi:hypothetical protein